MYHGSLYASDGYWTQGPTLLYPYSITLILCWPFRNGLGVFARCFVNCQRHGHSYSMTGKRQLHSYCTEVIPPYSSLGRARKRPGHARGRRNHDQAMHGLADMSIVIRDGLGEEDQLHAVVVEAMEMLGAIPTDYLQYSSCTYCTSSIASSGVALVTILLPEQSVQPVVGVVVDPPQTTDMLVLWWSLQQARRAARICCNLFIRLHRYHFYLAQCLTCRSQAKSSHSSCVCQPVSVWDTPALAQCLYRYGGTPYGRQGRR